MARPQCDTDLVKAKSLKQFKGVIGCISYFLKEKHLLMHKPIPQYMLVYFGIGIHLLLHYPWQLKHHLNYFQKC